MSENYEILIYYKLYIMKCVDNIIRSFYCRKYRYVFKAFIPALFFVVTMFKECICFKIKIIFENEAEFSQVALHQNICFIDNSVQIKASNEAHMEYSQPENQNLLNCVEPIYEVIGNNNDTILDSKTHTHESKNSAKKKKLDALLSVCEEQINSLNNKSDDSSFQDENLFHKKAKRSNNPSSSKKQLRSKNQKNGINEGNSKDPTFIVFDYSDKYVIRSKYFDKYIGSEFTDLKFNIWEITKTNIDIKTFEIFLSVLYFGKYKKSLNLKIEKFMSFLEIFYDLFCYARSDVICSLYKNLIPVLIMYRNDLIDETLSEMPENISLRQKNLFLPFMNTFFDKVSAKFEINNDEFLVLKKTDQQNEVCFSHKEIIKDIKIRTTPETLMLLGRNFNSHTKLIPWILFILEINGIKISCDNMYYYEREEYEKEIQYGISNKILSNPKSKFLPSGILLTIKWLKIKKLKFLELERIKLRYEELAAIKQFINLESLILVKCILPEFCSLFAKLYSNFRKLKTLKIIGFVLTSTFFNNLKKMKIQYLDISCSIYKRNTYFLKPWNRDNQLNNLRLDYSHLGYDVIDNLMKSKNLKYLSMRNLNSSWFKKSSNYSLWPKRYEVLNLSGCIFHKNLLNFFSKDLQVDNILLEKLNILDLTKILKQKSLHLSTKKLDISKCALDLTAINFLKMFEILEILILRHLPQCELPLFAVDFFFKSHLISVDLSNSQYIQNEIIFLLQFGSLRIIKIPRCNLEVGFMKSIFTISQYSSVEHLDISENQLDTNDLYSLSLFTNLKYLVITLDSAVYIDYLTNHDKISHLELNTLILVKSYINQQIFQFIMEQPSVKHILFKYSTMIDNVIPVNLTYCMKYIKSIKFSDSLIFPGNLNTLVDLQKQGIIVDFCEKSLSFIQ
ncbi:hypothetical protein CWI38_0527p0010 [Hamiltosporidium tvaerminnensis]|uniref:Uncharacterized protein n=1 Tax=Hamiltosporidium tvaerminnensis TaxID=1176355 RepID=A0A4V2JXU4_9MICR|nr:hypothetical protein CWI38_0527p0010 [Hamiltosporidium tvaerminnensis]